MRRPFADTLERDVAWERAEALLRESLTDVQYESYQARGYLEIPSRLYPARVYRVDGWRPVAAFEQGRFLGAVCIRPREDLPGPDVVLARKLLIEGAEEEFLKGGNWLSPAWRPASAAPSMLLMFFLVTPWLAQLTRQSHAWLAAVPIVLALPAGLFVWRRRARRTG